MEGIVIERIPTARTKRMRQISHSAREVGGTAARVREARRAMRAPVALTRREPKRSVEARKDESRKSLRSMRAAGPHGSPGKAVDF